MFFWSIVYKGEQVYKRVILKLSGESMAESYGSFGIDYKKVKKLCFTIKECLLFGVQMGIVVGGGNFWRGREHKKNIDVSVADQMGMLSTVLNALYLKEIFEEIGVKSSILTTIPIPSVTEGYNYKKALNLMESNNLLIFGGGTGNTHFSTDSAASLRAAELKADVLLKATTVDGVYDSDPKINKNAHLYDAISFDNVLRANLKVMDSTAFAMCKDNNIKVLVFNVSDCENIKRAVLGEKIGTLISN